MSYCTNERHCLPDKPDYNCPLWKRFCSEFYIKDQDENETTFGEIETLHRYDERDLTFKEKYSMCEDFRKKGGIELRLGIPGMASGKPFERKKRFFFIK